MANGSRIANPTCEASGNAPVNICTSTVFSAKLATMLPTAHDMLCVSASMPQNKHVNHVYPAPATTMPNNATTSGAKNVCCAAMANAIVPNEAARGMQ